MAKLLLRGEYFDSIAPHALFETDYEKLLLAHGEYLYPHSHLVKFKCDVESEYGVARADLALIDRSYRGWWVVEVELGSHSLRNHVEPQVRILANGNYGKSHADHLAENGPHLDGDALREMVKGAQPRVLVLVNEPKPEWVPVLRQWDARVGIVEVFRSEKSVEVLRINGEHPDSFGDWLSNCRVDPLLPNSLIVDSPASLSTLPVQTIQIWFNNGVTEWKRVDAANRVWIMPIHRWPLPSKVTEYYLTRDAVARLHLIPKTH